MTKLPTTSFMRMVDIWLITAQLVLFVEVILLTILELYNEETDVINHHGRDLVLEIKGENCEVEENPKVNRTAQLKIIG